jgi:hypothetical protein
MDTPNTLHRRTSPNGDRSSFFLQYPNFVPDRSAPLHHEIDRLAKQEGWHARKISERRAAAYSAEAALQCGSSGVLERLQTLCVDAGVARADCVPKSIKLCRKASSFCGRTQGAVG